MNTFTTLVTIFLCSISPTFAAEASPTCPDVVGIHKSVSDFEGQSDSFSFVKESSVTAGYFAGCKTRLYSKDVGGHQGFTELLVKDDVVIKYVNKFDEEFAIHNGEILLGPSDPPAGYMLGLIGMISQTTGPNKSTEETQQFMLNNAKWSQAGARACSMAMEAKGMMDVKWEDYSLTCKRTGKMLVLSIMHRDDLKANI